MVLHALLLDVVTIVVAAPVTRSSSTLCCFLCRPVAAPQVIHVEKLGVESEASEGSEQWHVQTVAAQVVQNAMMQ